VLTDERHTALFSAEERELIRRHIPWTAVVEERSVSRDGTTTDLIGLLRTARDRFVIKPNDEYGGTGVTLGWETSESDWDAAIARASPSAIAAGWRRERIAVRREVSVCDSVPQVRHARHARRFCTLYLSRTPRGVSDAPECDRPR
jgi:hypothetical protein